MIRKEEALAYHAEGRPGKLEVIPTKPVASQRDLSLAYTPGVAEPCREIEKNRDMVDVYTGRKNLVAVVTNGTAVLGLGDIGPYAAKPVMEGKAVLFKRYADIDVFDIEVSEKDPNKLVEIIAALEPTFGGINLEDIRAPECFVIERMLRERMQIPVFHDDQHGTAIISAAALKNAAIVQQKELSSLNVVCIGAGAAAIACMDLWVKLGVKKERITITDRHGIVRHGRPEGVDPSKENYARPASDSRRSLAEALVDADVMIGLASANLVTGEMIQKMAKKPIIMALANPDPEIPYEEAVRARPDAVVATGRSDYPNQVNNVLGFPFIFRGALDVRARSVNDEMKLAAAEALAALTREDVPDKVLEAYGGEPLRFGPHYIIPKPVDPRVLYWVAPAVARAAIESGSARDSIDIDKYRDDLARKISPTRKVLWGITTIAKRDPKRVVFPEGEEPKILRAAQIVIEEGIAKPILIGSPERIRAMAEEIGVNLDERVEIVHPPTDPRLERYADALALRRARRGVTRADALKTLTRARTHFGMTMVYCGDADGCVSGLTTNYPETIRPALQIIGVRKNVNRAAGTYIVITHNDVKFLADTTINIEPDTETIAETAILTAEFVQELGIEPRVGMLSFSNFGDAPHPSSRRMARATEIVKKLRPEIMIDGEMQADIALDEHLRAPYPFSTLEGSANVLIFPNLDAGNIAYKLLGSTAKADVIGPIVLGLRRPVNVLQRGATVDTIVHIAAITVARFIRLERAGLEPLTQSA